MTHAMNAPSAAPGTAENPLPRPPEAMRPDRPEVMAQHGSGERSTLAPGATFECLVGAHNRAINLTTGMLTLAPGASWDCHTYRCSESLTLLSGAAEVAVEGRVYTLGAFDNVVIPAGLARTVRNLSSTEPATLHLILAASAPVSEPAEDRSTRQPMPPASTAAGTTPERFNHFETAPRSAAGPNTEFIDYFNAQSMPGLDMSGGYGLFHPGGRLLAHVHDFDESISIVRGEATCVVEGRRYTMQASTALQPRGRVHYFINQSSDTMVMLWVYAGPMPDRIVVDERCTTPEGDPWKS